MSSAVIGAGLGVGFLGCLFFPLLFLILLVGTMVAAALGWIFWPLVLLCDIGILPCDAGDGGSDLNQDQVTEAYHSDGRGGLNEVTVPSSYLPYIKEAGAECTQIGPLAIAGQIQQESGFNEKLVGPDGAEGLSQMPPDKFKEFGKDDDSNGKTSALDADDSIRAQGRYMCSLAKEIDTLVTNNEVTGDRLDLTLAAYDAGLDAVKAAKGVPDTQQTQSYIIGVRSSFALYSENVKLPAQESYPTTLSPRPTPSSPRPTPSSS
ncbi:lytic transglycosylase domain-containing protein [Streptomyces sp. RP5T]|uniref:lytic transglycosylase domain-containing protein n=1 Tax=Streptomyces sp. RP5T TaxID=2490848 RepID=UPI000F64E355|nr:lytic transglycosylase domain-containing protein [Streptomyces sp. RP5T]RRR86551.1 lytic transglycosylase domain-containing protein [Streptomyces sp. RP5T]